MNYVNKTFTVPVSSGKGSLRPGTAAWERHVLCDGLDCPKCRAKAREPLIVAVPTLSRVHDQLRLEVEEEDSDVAI